MNCPRRLQAARACPDFRPAGIFEAWTEIQAGIRQHRAIDAFTDAHPALVSCRRAIAGAGAPRFTAGILADIFWDHVLASEWASWGLGLCGLELQPFCEIVHARLGQTEGWHSPGFVQAYPWIVGLSWLSSYARLEGISLSLSGISRRMSGRPRLEDSIGILVALDEPIRRDFAAFWPDLVAFARSWSAAQADR
jgi:acyl carrier protein phosphodiesterase